MWNKEGAAPDLKKAKADIAQLRDIVATLKRQLGIKNSKERTPIGYDTKKEKKSNNKDHS